MVSKADILERKKDLPETATSLKKKIFYPWMKIMYGNPERALAALDVRREAILAEVPSDPRDIPEETVTEWMCLTAERNKTFQKIIQNRIRVLYDKKIVEIYRAIQEHRELQSLHAVDNFFPSLATALIEIRIYLTKRNIKDHLERPRPRRTVHCSTQTEANKVAEDARTAPTEAAPPVGKIHESQNLSFEWNPTVTSTPLKKMIEKSKKIEEIKITKNDSEIFFQKEKKVLLEKSSPPTAGDRMNLDWDGLDDSAEFESERSQGKTTELNNQHRETFGFNGILERSSSCPVPLTDLVPATALSSLTNWSSIGGSTFGIQQRTCTVSAVALNAVPVMGTRFKTNGWALPVQAERTENLTEISGNHSVSHNESID